MKKYCSISGEPNCRCYDGKESISPLKVDIRSTFRKLWTDHGVYIAFMINSSVDGSKDVRNLRRRLMENQEDIGNLLKEFIGEDKGNDLIYLLKEHIDLIDDFIVTSISNKGKMITINKLFSNGDDISVFLSSLNPEKLPLQKVIEMFNIHVNFVMDLCELRIDGKYDQQIKTYDQYYLEILEMSDMITDAL